MKTKMINVRVNDDLKKECESVFNELGLNTSTAIVMFLKSVVRTKSIPLNLEITNKETLKAAKEIELISKGKKKAKIYSDVNDLKKDLEL